MIAVSIIYRREIDGLRALAILPVILFHGGFDPFRGGFVGVDVFFVISGYLITTIIVADVERGAFSIGRFYERRARRILPALFLVMLVSVPLAWFSLWPVDMREFCQSLIAVPLFGSNFLFWRQSGYFETATELKPLIHTWSLAVEEQFYLAFPLFLRFVPRLRQKRAVIIMTVTAVASFAAAQWMSIYAPAAGFYLIPSRAWELLIGVFAAFHLSGRPGMGQQGPLGEGASALGLILILGSVFAYDRNIPFPGLYALAPTCGTALVIVFATSETRIGRLLGNRILVGIGLISYSAYLWHQPLFAFARHLHLLDGNRWIAVLAMLASFALAFVSYVAVELPFRDRNMVSLARVIGLSLAVSVVLMTFGGIGAGTFGFRDFFAAHRLSAAQRESFQFIKRHTDYDFDASMVDDGACRFGVKDIDPVFEDRFRKCAEQFGKAYVVVGDSHGMNAYNIVAKSGISPFVAGVAQGGCRPYDNVPLCHYDHVAAFVKSHSSAIQAVIFHQSGGYLFVNKDFVTYHDAEIKSGSFALFDSPIVKVQSYLAGLAADVPVIWLGPFVESQVDFKNWG